MTHNTPFPKKNSALVANAPHLPVHLGAMSEAVRYQVAHYAPGGAGADDPLRPGDVLCSNHPQLAGGSHLPDITVISPVFEAGGGGGAGPVFFVASRGHHADIGGISPGSMPPASKVLEEEGAAIVSFKLVRAGAFQVCVFVFVFCCCFCSRRRGGCCVRPPFSPSTFKHPKQKHTKRNTT